MTGMVIVGDGKAGVRAAVALRENGYNGPVTLTTGETHAPYDRPPLSKAIIINNERPAPPFLFDEATLKSINVTLVTGSEVATIDRAAGTVAPINGRIFAYHNLLLTTGAVPRRLNMAAMIPSAYAICVIMKLRWCCAITLLTASILLSSAAVSSV